jgi:hypothetical protein
MPEWIQCIELTRLNQVLLVDVVLENLVLGISSKGQAHPWTSSGQVAHIAECTNIENSDIDSFSRCPQRFPKVATL